MNKILLALATIALVLCLTGCNTVKGVGKDIHDSAQATQSWIDGDTQ